MCDKKFLYGASVQGIQGFIFSTNKLQEIIGASGLVEEVCTNLFEDEFKQNGELVVKAAGNVKCFFENEDECRCAVLGFPRRVMETAPGVTISQAVVEMENDDFKKACDELEANLHAQRNKPVKSLQMGCMAVERSRRTGLPAVTIDSKENEFVDEGTDKKLEFLNKGKASYSKTHYDSSVTAKLYENLYGEKVNYYTNIDIKDMTLQNDWLAIVHADGNGLGEVVARIGKDREKLRSFSESLSEVTIKAAQEACEEVGAKDEKGNLFIRPVVLGGDDLTVICRADLAVPFVEHYLKAFEEKSEANTNVGRLSACAGIAFIKSSYPFYYGYELAETLCGVAKKDAKSDEMKHLYDGKVASCLMYHKVQSSFVEDYAVIKQKELTPTNGWSFCFGPYYLKGNEKRWTIENLKNNVDKLSLEANNPIKTAVREWMTLMGEGEDRAAQKEKRIQNLSQYGDKQKKLFEEVAKPFTKEQGQQPSPLYNRAGVGKCSPAYDVLSLLTINTQQTK